MNIWRRSAAFVAPALAVVVIATPVGAYGDGLPVLGIDVGLTGVLTSDGLARYVTLPAGRQTVVARVARRDGEVLAARSLAGQFTIPAVAYDGSASGLSADGATLALITPRQAFPQASTGLVIVDARRLRTRTSIVLPGDFSFDAISPNGRWLYLINYISPRDANRYRVRAYDLRAGRLLTRPIVDADEPEEQMQGRPLTRAASADGRWAYTLYDGVGKEPFVHALDTATRTAHCVDLPMIGAADLPSLKLDVPPAGGPIRVMRGLLPVASIDRASFVASTPVVDAGDEPSGSWPLATVWGGGAAATVGALLAVLAARRRRARPVSA